MKIRIRPFHSWWLGVLFFAPAVFIWIAAFVLFAIKGILDCPFDWYGIRHIYLPFVAALVGLMVPIVCLRVLRRSHPRVWISTLLIYITVMLTWGVVDIRYQNYQVGGHNYPNGPLVDGHRYFSHHYYTWYFLPYRWIEKGIDG